MNKSQYRISIKPAVSFCGDRTSYNAMEAVENRFLFDAARTDEEKHMILDNYFNDIYALFLKKFTGFAIGLETSETDEKKLRDLLDELIKVRNMIRTAKP